MGGKREVGVAQKDNGTTGPWVGLGTHGSTLVLTLYSVCKV